MITHAHSACLLCLALVCIPPHRSSQFGPFVRIFIAVISETRQLLYLLGLILLGFGAAFFVLSGTVLSVERFGNLQRLVVNLIMMMLGELGDFHDFMRIDEGFEADVGKDSLIGRFYPNGRFVDEGFIGYLIFVIFIVIVPLVLINMLVALLSDIFDRVQVREREMHK